MWSLFYSEIRDSRIWTQYWNKFVFTLLVYKVDTHILFPGLFPKSFGLQIIIIFSSWILFNDLTKSQMKSNGCYQLCLVFIRNVIEIKCNAHTKTENTKCHGILSKYSISPLRISQSVTCGRVGGFLRVLRFPPPIKLTDTI